MTIGQKSHGLTVNDIFFPRAAMSKNNFHSSFPLKRRRGYLLIKI